MSYHNLTNEEIVFMYLFSKSIKEQYESVFEMGSISQIVPTEFGTIKVDTELPNDLISEMLDAKHYILMRSVHDKLKPLYELIIEVEPEIVTEIRQIFEKSN
jgi:hypothetical protein